MKILRTGSSLIFLLFLLFPFLGRSQKWVADTLRVSFGDSLSIGSSPFSVNSVDDHRSDFSSFLSVYETRKGLVFPVDQIVKTNVPLARSFNDRFSLETKTDQNYRIDIYEFSISNHKEMGKTKLKLNSSLEISNDLPKDSSLIGALYYSQSYVIPKDQSLQDAYEALLESWCLHFSSDVIAVEEGLDELLNNNLYHFRRGANVVSKNFYVGVEMFGGLNFWGIDAELWFSEPEESRMFKRSVRVMRYVNHFDFQSIAMGTKIAHQNYRISENYLLTNKFVFLIGFNNWKDMATASHKLEEIPLFNVSLNQRISYNHFDQKGMVFGLGVMEDLHYIIYHRPQLKIGLSLNFSYKF
jgi:hypothetical protein